LQKGLPLFVGRLEVNNRSQFHRHKVAHVNQIVNLLKGEGATSSA
jgi:hypothetical protein